VTTTSRVAWLVLLVVLVVATGCSGTSATARPSASLITLEFSPVPTTGASGAPSASGVAPSRGPTGSALAPSWPVGWDVSFCTAFADTTVAHELVIDIERAITDNSRTDAQGLANELAQSAPPADNEVKRLKDWASAADVKTSLTALLDLDTQVATAYQGYFNGNVKTGLHDARQLRTQVSKQVGPINTQLAALAALGVTCPGTTLALEKF
jgi:hypothetical protein